MFVKKTSLFLACLLSLGAVACGDGDDGTTADGGPDGMPGQNVEVAYGFESRFMPGESSVSYAGQTFRHVLIERLKNYIGSLSADIDSGTFVPTTEGDVVSN
ncbi:MAG: hypothetical protein MO852_13365, partial [Candidatus Devosia euplotis]|nr:hypothetical protein [Candidatus Devosia euplotis]